MSVFAALEVGDIAEVIWVSLVVGVAFTTVYSLVVFGGARSAAARRTGRRGAALVYGALATVCFALFAFGVVYGVHVMLAKS